MLMDQQPMHRSWLAALLRATVLELPEMTDFSLLCASLGWKCAPSRSTSCQTPHVLLLVQYFVLESDVDAHSVSVRGLNLHLQSPFPTFFILAPAPYVDVTKCVHFFAPAMPPSRSPVSSVPATCVCYIRVCRVSVPGGSGLFCLWDTLGRAVIQGSYASSDARQTLEFYDAQVRCEYCAVPGAKFF